MEDKIWTCIIKRLTGTETEDSRLLLDRWLLEEEKHVQHYQEAKALWELSAMVPPEVGATDTRELTMQMDLPIAKAPNNFKLFWKYGAVAALTGLLLFAAFHYSNVFQSSPKEEWMVVTAKPGEMTEFQLPDRSKVWLNAGTEVRFLKAFNTTKLREVQLKGEAYFEVHHDSTHPFVVNSGKLRTTVHGTSFSIRAYPDEAAIAVAVNSGKVGVETRDGKQAALMLLPEDKISYSGGQFLKTKVPKIDIDSWIKGELIFEQTSMPEVFATLARKYKVKIDAGKRDYSACKLTARFRNQPLAVVLKTLNISMNISSKQIADTIYLKGGNCM